jgi:hypothetical protein
LVGEQRREHFLHQILQILPQVSTLRLPVTPQERARHTDVDHRRDAVDQLLRRIALSCDRSLDQRSDLRISGGCEIERPRHPVTSSPPDPAKLDQQRPLFACER